MEVSQKEIVIVPFPFTNQEGKKLRPAVVVSNNHINHTLDDCIVIPLTSNLKDEPYSVIIYDDDLSQGSLREISRAKVNVIGAVNKKLVKGRVGFINDITFSKIREEIIKAI